MGKIVSGLLFIGAFIVFAVGWVLNIIALVKMTGVESLGLMVARVLGIFIAPLGSLLGWLV